MYSSFLSATNSTKNAPNKERITIMLLGASGVGKTAAINTIKNIAEGKQVHNLEIMKEVLNGRESNTVEVKEYLLTPTVDYCRNYDIVLIDTPSIDNPASLEKVNDYLKAKTIDVVAAVLNSTCDELNTPIMDDFDKVAYTSGAEKLFILTYSDGSNSNILEPLNDRYNHEYEKKTFNINPSIFFKRNASIAKGSIVKAYYDLAVENVKNFITEAINCKNNPKPKTMKQILYKHRRWLTLSVAIILIYSLFKEEGKTISDAMF